MTTPLPMSYRKLDANGDYTLGTGSDFLTGAAAVAQAVQTRLLLYTGEWFLDTTDGTPWRTDVLGKYTQQSYDSVIKARILETPGVNSIASYLSTFTPATRSLAVSVSLDTVYGTVTTDATL